jgi:hypothetical protein
MTIVKSVWRDMQSRDFVIALIVTLAGFLVTYHLGHQLDRRA